MWAGITAQERRDILRADAFAKARRAPLRTTLDFHPGHMTDFPSGELDAFFQDLRNRISTYLRRKKIGTFMVWARENYVGDRREHLHIVMYLPVRLRKDLENHLRQLYEGGSQLIRVGNRTSRINPETGRWGDGLEYRLKQLRGDAVGPPGRTQLYRETKNRHGGALVAPVLGKRCGVSRSLDQKTEMEWSAARKS